MIEEEDILRFISGQMDDSERTLFVEQMESDSELKRSVEHSKRVKNITNEQTKIFSQNVRSVVNKKKKKRKNQVWLLAASVSVFLIAALAYFVSTLSSSSNALVADYLEPFPDILTYRSNGDLKLDLSPYNRGNYMEAATLLQKEYNNRKEPLIALYLGVSYLLSNQNEKAFFVFDEIAKQDTLFEEDLMWYKSLSLINLGREEKAKILLQALSDSENIYSSKSMELLEDLE